MNGLTALPAVYNWIEEKAFSLFLPTCWHFLVSCGTCQGKQTMTENHWKNVFAEHDLHVNGLQRQIYVGTLVSSQERKNAFRPADQSLVKCWSTADFVPLSVLKKLDCPFTRRDIQESFLDSLENKSEGCLLAGSTSRRPVLSSPTLPRCSAVRRPDPTRPWCVRVLDSTIAKTKRVLVRTLTTMNILG